MQKIAADVLDLLSASMKSFLEFFTCCGQRQPGSSPSAEDKRLLSAPEHRRSMTRKLDRVIDGGGYDDDNHHEWKPSLVSIAEDDIFTEVSSGHDIGDPVAEQGRNLKRQVSSSSPRKGSGSSSNSPIRRAPVSTFVRPTLVSSRSFMF
ncbi:uncharacterized protein [Primulina huaijiensis]|uniref:uncharacterized protein n=1 Tax=Primulina huaijiensis TaxID=1492673 RepID=UPI003CC755F0